jgi:AcrR family transcriptional regulator
MRPQPERPQRSVRDAVVYAAAQLIRERGVRGTSLRDVAERASAPWGSMQHYFPGGKTQLVDEALAWSGRFAAERVRQYLDTAQPTPSGLLLWTVQQWQDELTRYEFRRGCPLVAATADVASTDEPLRESAERAFAAWVAPLTEAFVRLGIPARRAETLALVALSAVEGAIALSRARRDLVPLDAVTAELGPLLDAAADVPL